MIVLGLIVFFSAMILTYLFKPTFKYIEGFKSKKQKAAARRKKAAAKAKKEAAATNDSADATTDESTAIPVTEDLKCDLTDPTSESCIRPVTQYQYSTLVKALTNKKKWENVRKDVKSIDPTYKPYVYFDPRFLPAPVQTASVAPTTAPAMSQEEYEDTQDEALLASMEEE